MYVFIVHIVYPAYLVVGHSYGTHTGDVVIFLVFVVEGHHSYFRLLVVGQYVDRRAFHYVVFVGIHVGVVQAEEYAHVLEVDVAAVVDKHSHLVVVLRHDPVGGWLDAHIEEGLLHEQLLEDAVHVLFAILHVGEQTVVDALVAPAVEVVEYLFLAALYVAAVGIVFCFDEVGAEHSVAFHG